MSQFRFLQSSGFTNDLLIGLPDGIMLSFALAAAMSVISPHSSVIIIACSIESIILAFMLGFASYFTLVNQAEENLDGLGETMQKRPRFVPHLQLKEILTRLELGPEIMEKAGYETVEYHRHWGQMLSEYGVGTPLPDFPRARKNGLNVGLTFLTGACITLFPFFIISDSATAFKYAIPIVFGTIILLGIFKANYTGQNRWVVTLRLVLTCLVTALAAFLVPYLFTH